MRIISGYAGGIRLDAPAGTDVRPTVDRVKESMFASLGDIRGWQVADLFAGSGGLGLEALSRGAKSAIFVESRVKALRVLERNVQRAEAAMTDAGHCPEARVVQTDVRSVPHRLARLAGTLDLILADPPYEPARGCWGAADMLADNAFASWAGDALLVLEHASRAGLPWSPLSPWTVVRQKNFGLTTITFARAVVA